MGHEYFKRPVRVVGSTSIIPAVDISGAVTLTAALNLDASTLTATTSVQTLAADSVIFLTQGSSAAAHQVNIPAPLAQGEVRYVFIDLTTSANLLHIRNASSSDVFFGTTYNGVSFDAAASENLINSGTPGLMLAAASTSQWAISVLCSSTNVFLYSNSTGSTNA